MKRLIIGKPIQESSGMCDWCGESKQGYVSDPLKTEHYHLKDNKRCEWLKPIGMFATKKLYWVIEPESEWSKVSIQALICADCVKQLAKK